jgi:Rrf2 family transcriptional regulator, iron-sulfur cluster assembly transcription factor
MLVSRSATHALNALVVLGALPGGECAGAARIAGQINAPSNYLGKLLRALSRAGVVEGRKGSDGGFRLSRSPGAISLFEVLDPIEHLSQVDRCILGNFRCTARTPCSIHQRWSLVRDHYLDFLKTTTLADVTAQPVSAGRRKGGKNGRAAMTAAGGVR